MRCFLLGVKTTASSVATYLVFVGGVEGDLGHLLVPLPHHPDRAAGQLDALEQGRLGGVASHVALEDGHRVLSRLELSAVAQGGDAGQPLPRHRALVERGAWRKREKQRCRFKSGDL